eukprot:TRINITY_DN28215_c0_g2_i1.p1 TRINITY_DN28215_c0_g2~~TRINITY_DN28215_c0_g2_i1.p1  ORF type:complete len:382 (-),score=73.41 TRINITY_DN28215_c0_g2_i1:79-1152(-)
MGRCERQPGHLVPAGESDEKPLEEAVCDVANLGKNGSRPPCDAVAAATPATKPSHLAVHESAATKKEILRRALSAAAAGTTGALLSTVLLYPIELIKNRLQAAALGKGGFYYKGLLDGLQSVFRTEGLRGLFVGLGPVLSRCFVSDFATFYFSELFVRSSGVAAHSAAALPLRVAGASVSTMLSLPLENVSTRVTVAQPSVSAAGAAAQLWREGGLPAFWRGAAVMQVLCINPGLTMCAFDWLKRLHSYFQKAVRQALTDDSEKELTTLQAFLVGSVAKLLTMCFVYPLIRGKFLIQGRDNGQAGLFRVLKETYRDCGVSGLYKGLDAQLSKSLLSTGIQFATKERTERVWKAILFP